jgi:hypothetical protein
MQREIQRREIRGGRLLIGLGRIHRVSHPSKEVDLVGEIRRPGISVLIPMSQMRANPASVGDRRKDHQSLVRGRIPAKNDAGDHKYGEGDQSPRRRACASRSFAPAMKF